MIEMLLLLLGFIALAAVIYWYCNIPSGLPPGSSGLPILGYLPFLGHEPYFNLASLSKKYGNLFFLYFGSQLVIIINDYHTLKQAFINQGEVFSGRPPVFKLSESKDDNLGITSVEGEFWRQHRQFLTKSLKNCGYNDDSGESLILEEIKYLINDLRKSSGNPVVVKDVFIKSFVNNINLFVTGKRMDYDNPTLNTMIFHYYKILSCLPNISLSLFFPWMKGWMGSEFLFKRNLTRKHNNSLLEICSQFIHKSSEEIDTRRNYIDEYLNERGYRCEHLSSYESIFTDTGLLHNIRDLIGAGIETTLTTLHWALLYVTKYPEVQTKIRKELDNVYGKDRAPSWKCRMETSYTEATLNEIMRIVTISPMSVQRRTVRPTKLCGYRIPADAMVIPLLYSIHHDVKIWGDPDVFRPERFLDADGKFVKSKYLVPFSIGKRACIGEQFARMELYLYFTSLLLNFDFISPNGVEPSLEVNFFLTRQPKYEFICVRERKI